MKPIKLNLSKSTLRIPLLCLIVVVNYSIVLCSTTLATANSHRNDSSATARNPLPFRTRNRIQENHVQDRFNLNHVIISSSQSDNELVRQQQELGTNEQKQRGKRQSDSLDDEQQQNYDSATSHHHHLAANYEHLTLSNQDQQQQLVATTASQQQQQKGKRTLYACEEKQLEIECQLGESIQLIRANYGRFSIQICNEHGQLDWKVNCMSSSSFQIISDSCQAKQSCQLLASNTIFGDSCPGTQKYLEVHYQCVPAGQLQSSASNRTSSQADGHPQLSSATANNGGGRTLVIQQQQAASQRPTSVTNNKNVIQQQFDPSTATATTIAGNSETSFSANSNNNRQRWPAYTPGGGPAQLPPWIMDSIPMAPALPSPPVSSSNNMRPTTDAAFVFKRPVSAASGVSRCPEIPSWRQIRWPATEAGLVAQMPCPAHAHPANAAAASVDNYVTATASLACLPSGQWAQSVSAGQCQSNWLRNLTQRLDLGDSPLSILVELVHWTRPQLIATPANGLFGNQQQQQQQQHATLALFGDDLHQIGRIVRRLVDEMGELLARIQDDRQRFSFAREMIQLLIELANNLASEIHSDAWLDLVPSTRPAATTTTAVAGERQRVAGQLISSLENAVVLFAGTTSSSSSAQLDTATTTVQQQEVEDFLKMTENVFVSIRSVNVDSSAAAAEQNQTSNIDLTFPSRSSSLGTKWTSSEQKFTLHLQTTTGGQQEQQPVGGVNSMPAGQQQQLKVVFIMLHNLGQQMDPPQSSNQQPQQRRQFIVNSDLVSLSIVVPSQHQSTSATATTVADVTSKRNSQVKVELSSPIELVFKHQQQSGEQMFASSSTTQPTSEQQWNQMSGTRSAGGSLAPPRCVFWDTNISEWQSDGCKLISTNQTHSVCACNHLTTFALLAEWDSSAAATTNPIELRNLAAPTSTLVDQQQQQQQQQKNVVDLPRVQLDNVENELVLTNRKALYLAKLLEGNLFGGSSGSFSSPSPNVRPFIYASFLLAALLLALQLAAAAYSRAQARRWLGAMPMEPPPPLLVSNNHNTGLRNTTTRLEINQPRTIGRSNEQQQQQHSSPSYSSSDYSAALTAATSKTQQQLIRQSALDTNQYDCFQSGGNSNNAASNTSPYDYDSSPTLSWMMQNGQPKYLDQYLQNHQHQSNSKARPPTTDLLSNWRQLAVVPIHLIVQLLFLQLLLVLLVESQNYLSRTVRQQFPNNPASNVYFNAAAAAAANTWPANFFSRNSGGGGITSEPIGDSLNPIGLITCLLVFALYYLISSLTCWLLAQLIRLNASIFVMNQGQAAAAAAMATATLINIGDGQQPPTKHAHSTSNSTASSTAPSDSGKIIMQQHQQQPHEQMAAHNFYGGHQQQQQLQHSSISPSSSSYSSVAAANGATDNPLALTTNRRCVIGQQQQLTCKLSSSSSNNSSTNSACCSCKLALLALCLNDRLNWFLVHICPLLISSALLWFSTDQSQLINRVSYTMSYGTQLAYWPLLVDSSWFLPLGLLLFCMPAICLALGFMALLSLRRHFQPRQRCRIIATNGGQLQQQHHQQQQLPKPMISMVNGQQQQHEQLHNNSNLSHALHTNPYGTSQHHHQFVQHHHHHQQQQQQLQQPFVLNKQSTIETNDEAGELQQHVVDHDDEETTTQAAAVQSLLWQNYGQQQQQHEQQPANGGSRFEAKTKRAKLVCFTLVALLALHSICWISFFAHCYQVLNQPQQQSGNLLIWTFGSSNLLIALLITWTQRKTVRRSAQLAGLTRLFSCFSNNSNNNEAAKQQQFARRQQQRARRLHSSTTTGRAAATCGLNGVKSTLKVSPSSQSLFLVSSRPSAHHFQSTATYASNNIGPPTTAGYHYGPAAYSSFAHQPAQQRQQHLYQQLTASHQHIYDSTSNLNQAASMQQQHQEQPLNAMRLMQQQQQQQFHHLNGFNEHQQQQHGFHTLNRSQLHIQQQHELQRPTAMTLARGQSSNGNNNNKASFQQQQQQLLICPTSASSIVEPQIVNQQQQQQPAGEVDGPLVALMSNNSMSSQSKQQQAAATFGPIHSSSLQQATMFSNGQSNNQQEPTEHRLFNGQQQQQRQQLAGLAGSDANQRQCCNNQQQQQTAATSPPSTTQQNYNEALKMALLLKQEQQQQQPPNSVVGQQQNFRRANSKHERHRTTTTSSSMIDGQIMNHAAAKQQQFAASANNSDRSTSDSLSLANNIYDVANYAIH